MNDTPTELDAALGEMLMSRSGEERLRMGAGMFDSAVLMMRAGIDTSDEVEMRMRILERLYGDELKPEVIRKIALGIPPRRRHDEVPRPEAP